MSLKKALVILPVLVIALCSCFKAGGPKVKASKLDENSAYLAFISAMFEKNLVQDPGKRNLVVRLPSGYVSSKKRYPVIYCLHGFGGSSMEFLSAEKGIKAVFEAAPEKECILVGVDGTGPSGGSFYANSPVTGRWEDYVVQEAVPLVDRRYRSIAAPESRAIFGYSMGGFAALNIALGHPDVFKVAFGLSPGVFAEDGLRKAIKTWDESVFASYASAFAPDEDPEKKYRGVPVFDGSAEDAENIALWESGFGNWEGRISEYLGSPARLAGLKICYGKIDEYRWIPEGVSHLSKLLAASGIEHELSIHEGGHFINAALMEGEVLPFLTGRLAY